jgi:hypothetical protein
MAMIKIYNYNIDKPLHNYENLLQVFKMVESIDSELFVPNLRAKKGRAVNQKENQTKSIGLRSFSCNSLYWEAESPVTFLNWLDK